MTLSQLSRAFVVGAVCVLASCSSANTSTQDPQEESTDELNVIDAMFVEMSNCRKNLSHDLHDLLRSYPSFGFHICLQIFLQINTFAELHYNHPSAVWIQKCLLELTNQMMRWYSTHNFCFYQANSFRIWT